MKIIIVGVVLFMLTLSTSSCTVCVNGQGIGCGQSNPRYPTTEEKRRSEEQFRTNFTRSLINRVAAPLRTYDGTEGSRGFTHEVDEIGLKRLNEALNPIVESIRTLARKHRSDSRFIEYFDSEDLGRRLRIEIYESKSRYLIPNCDTNTIEIPTRFLELLLTRTTEDPLYDTSRKPFRLGLGQVRIPIESDGQRFNRVLAVNNTRLKRALTFVLAHEAQHIYSNQCFAHPDPVENSRLEARADFFGAIIASEIFSDQCDYRRPFFLNEEDFQRLILLQNGAEQSEAAKMLADIMVEYGAEDFFVTGGTDMEYLLEASSDPENRADFAGRPSYTEVIGLNDDTKFHFMEIFFENLFADANNHWALRLSRALGGDELEDFSVEQVFTENSFGPNVVFDEKIVDDSVLACGSISFR